MQERTRYLKKNKSQHLPFTRKAVVRAILLWYTRQGRSLPWRGITDPYRILVSEVMLQQTQVSRVLIKYPEFLRRFPTLRRLAAAKQRDVVITWKGMGYNNRAVRLHRLAKIVMSSQNCTLPRSLEELMALPGIGKYTAHALLASAFRKAVPVVDVNVQRLFSRAFGRMRSTNDMRPADEIWVLAGTLVPRQMAYDWNQALMDLGATICTARAPRCDRCPLASMCLSRQAMSESARPPKKKEPTRDGVPHRIYRGRIIETLRQHRGHKKLHADAIGRAIHPRYSTEHRPWLEMLLTNLEKDGLIRQSGIERWNTRRIALA